jgi:hypothetical protein
MMASKKKEALSCQAAIKKKGPRLKADIGKDRPGSGNKAV